MVGAGVNKFSGRIVDSLTGQGAPQGLPTGFPTTQTGYGVNLPNYLGGSDSGISGPQFSQTPVPNYGVSAPNIGFNPSIGGIGAPQVGGVSPPQDWTGSLTGNNPFGGQYGGNLGIPTMPPVNARRPIGGALNFAGGHFNNGTGAGTGYGASSYANDGWGQTALGFGVGTGFGSGGNFALADAQKAAAINRV